MQHFRNGMYPMARPPGVAATDLVRRSGRPNITVAIGVVIALCERRHFR
jgi:hypothetical protein